MIATNRIRHDAGAETADTAVVHDPAIRLFLETITDGFFAVDANWLVTHVNSEGVRLSRATPEEIVGRVLWDLFPGVQESEVAVELQRSVREGVPVEFEHCYLPWQVWFHTKASPAGDGGLSIFFQDITARKLVESERTELLVREREARDEAQTLNEISRALAGELDLEKVVQLATDAATRLTGAQFGAFFYNVHQEQGEAYLLYTLSGAPREAFEKLGYPRNTAVFAPTFHGTGIVRSDDILEDPRYGQMGPHHGMPKGHLPVRSYLAVPVIGRGGEILGGLFFGHSTPGVFTERAERLAAGIASHASIAVDNARLFLRAERSEQRFRGVFESSAMGVAILTCQSEFRQANPAFCAITGYSEAELAGLSCNLLLHPGDRAGILDRIAWLVAGAIPTFAAEARFLTKDGHAIWVKLSVSLTRDTKGQPEHLIALCEDITGRKQAEQASDLLSAIVDSSGDAIVSKNLDGIITSWNKGAERIFGYTAAEVLGKPVTLLIPADRQEEEPNILKRLQRGERVEHFETIRRRKDGMPLNVSLTISPVKDGNGKIVGASKIARDITDQKRAEEALIASEARFRQLADAMPQMVWTARADGYPDYYNERWYDFTGFDRNTFGAASWEPLLHPEDLPLARAAWEEAVNTGQPYRIQYRFRDRHEDRWRWFMGGALPVRDAQGRVERWFGSCTDIDEQKRREAELRQANQDLEQFAFSASHDLQEPLRTIKIYSELLITRHAAEIEGDARGFLDFLRGAATRMELLVRDLLAYTQIGKLEAPAATIDANEALTEAMDNLRGAVEVSGARVLTSPLPTLRVDAIHLRQLFQNIIGNAIKYRSADRPPEVEVTCQRQGEVWVFSVRDNGIGIYPQYKEQIFGLFKRLHTVDEYSGTGIGLAICQRIVERYHGRIWVESKPGEGSIFRFELPA